MDFESIASAISPLWLGPRSALRSGLRGCADRLSAEQDAEQAEPAVPADCKSVVPRLESGAPALCRVPSDPHAKHSRPAGRSRLPGAGGAAARGRAPRSPRVRAGALALDADGVWILEARVHDGTERSGVGAGPTRAASARPSSGRRSAASPRSPVSGWSMARCGRRAPTWPVRTRTETTRSPSPDPSRSASASPVPTSARRWSPLARASRWCGPTPTSRSAGTASSSPSATTAARTRSTRWPGSGRTAASESPSSCA